jgi:hypothetical protein
VTLAFNFVNGRSVVESRRFAKTALVSIFRARLMICLQSIAIACLLSSHFQMEYGLPRESDGH